MPTQTEVDNAERMLLSVSDTQDTWSPKELRQTAGKELPSTPFELISLAFWRLLNRGELVLDDENRRVRRATHGIS